MGPDYRVLIKRARKAAHEYKLYYGFEIPTAQLVTSHALREYVSRYPLVVPSLYS